MTPVEEKLLAIASRELGGAPSDETILAVREAVSDHALWEAADWLLPLLQRLIDGAPTFQRIEIPAGYPAGESGLANVLADLVLRQASIDG